MAKDKNTPDKATDVPKDPACLSPTRAKIPSFSIFTSLQYSNFSKLWAASFFLSGSNAIHSITIGWLIWTLSESPLLVGTITALRFVPFLAVGPLAGVFIDRIDRRQLLIASQLALAISALLFATLVATGTVKVWHVAVYMVIFGSLWAIVAPVRQSLVVNTVPRKYLMNAIALQSVAPNVIHTIVPVVAGLLIPFIGMEGNFYVSGILHIVAMIIVLPLKTPFSPEAETSTSTSIVSSLREGISYIIKNRILLGLLIVATIPALFITPLIRLLPVVTAQVFQAGPQVLGLLMTSFGVGSLVGTVVMASLGKLDRKGTILFITLSLATVGIILFAQSHWLVIGTILLAIVGVCELGFIVIKNTLIQSIVPDHIRGRVSSIYMSEHGLTPVGTLFLGSLMEVWGAQTSIAISGIVALGLVLFIATRVRQLRQL